MKITDINGIEREVISVAPDPGYPGFMRVEFKRHHEWMSFDEFLEKNPHLKHLLDHAAKPPADVVGVVTGATKNTLTDKDQSWKKDAYLGMIVWISRGLGEGQKRTVIKNTKITLNVDRDWDPKPNATSQYVLTARVQDSVRAMGNTLPQEDMKALEKRAIQMDKNHGRLSSESLKKNIKYLKPEEI
jgi:hypothetical protein